MEGVSETPAPIILSSNSTHISVHDPSHRVSLSKDSRRLTASVSLTSLDAGHKHKHLSSLVRTNRIQLNNSGYLQKVTRAATPEVRNQGCISYNEPKYAFMLLHIRRIFWTESWHLL
jgi:hypothetical protein